VPKELVLIINPRAGRWKTAWNESALRALFEPIGFGVSVHVTRGPGDARQVAAERAGSADVIGVVGGDGTVHEVANGVVPRATPIVVVPSGSGNDFASLLSCPKTPRELAEVIAGGWGADLDVIDLGTRYCVNSAGLGFEGLVNRLSHGYGRIGGRTRYVIALFRALRLYHSTRLTIETSRGDKFSGEMLLVSIGNGRRTGGAFHLTPGAFPDDGLIDVCLVESMSRRRMLLILPRALDGSLVTRPEVRIVRAESLVVGTESPCPMHVDGEYVELPRGNREIKLVPRGLHVLCRRSATNVLSREIRKIL
jgi:diacylglycerol kinase (ATP)